MDAKQIASELLDSKKFNDSVRVIAERWRKRDFSDDERLKSVIGIVDSVMAKCADIAGGPASRAARVSVDKVAEGERQEPPKLYDMSDNHDLPFDPFKSMELNAEQLRAQAEATKEPEPADVMTEHLNMLKDAIAKLPPHGIGADVRMLMNADWNAGNAHLFFREVPYQLHNEGVKFVKQGNNFAWEVKATRIG
jgi:hypothetical protein